jgi:hypothetical protein
VDLKKAFDMIPREKLWARLIELGDPNDWRSIVHRLYGKVNTKIRTQEGLLDSVNRKIEVKQGFPLSSTLFGIYIK